MRCASLGGMSDLALYETVELLSSRAAASRVGVDPRALSRVAEEAGVAPFASVSGLRTSRRGRGWAALVWDVDSIRYLSAWARARGMR